MGCRTLRSAWVRSVERNSKSAGSARVGRDDFELELRPHNREPWRGARDGWTQSVCGSVRVPAPSSIMRLRKMSPPGTQRPCGSALGRTGAQIGDSLSHRFPVLCHCSMSAFRDKPENVCSFRAPALNEVVFFHPATRTLVLTDLAFNIPREAAKRSPLFYWLWDVGHLGPHRFVRLRAIRDRQAARGSVEKILSWNFDRIIVSHGEVLETDGHNQFAAAFAFLRHRQ